MSITAKPTSYTVNTGHARCPDHLWMMDEGSGTTLVDQGKVGGLDITLQNADMWGTDTGDLGSAVVNFASATSRYARRTGYTPPSSSALWVALVKPASATIGAAAEVLCGIAKSDAASTAYGHVAYSATTGTPTVLYDYGTNASGNQTGPTDLYETTWAMIAGMVRGSEGTTQIIKKLSYNGSAWQNSSAYAGYTFPNDAGGDAPNAIGIGCRPSQTVSNIFNGSILAVMAWDDLSWATADNAFIASLYDDPWQFLQTGVTTLKLLAHASAASAANIEGVVLNAARDTVIGEFTGQAFEAALESGEAVLYVPVTDIIPDGATLTTLDTPLVFAYNATDSIVGPGSATVVEI